MSGTAISEGLHHTNRAFRDKWISEQGAGNTCGDEDYVEADDQIEIEDENEEGRQSDEEPRVDGCDGRNAPVLSKGKSRRKVASNNRFWVPYVHYGM